MTDILLVYASNGMLKELASEDGYGESSWCYNMSASFLPVQPSKTSVLEQALLWFSLQQWEVHFVGADIDKVNTMQVKSPGRYTRMMAPTWLAAAIKHYEKDTDIRWAEESLQNLVDLASEDEHVKADLQAAIAKLQGKVMPRAELLRELQAEVMVEDAPMCEIVADFCTSSFRGLTRHRAGGEENDTIGVIVKYSERSSGSKSPSRRKSASMARSSSNGEMMPPSPTRRASLGTLGRSSFSQDVVPGTEAFQLRRLYVHKPLA
mmetsp:Transcript_44516/g.79981  ORF Transcript_44516/g.79981 Transcript_44516/m.79981 type:complete len:264 (-) Transcript_44516:294-1085(-)